MKRKTVLDPRAMMLKAIEVMHQSIHEPQRDKPSPKVGAVLVKPDGSVITASRGELREGDHAEFTLLERKCHGEDLAGGILFATLEPCLDRLLPKRGCARHIVNARIAEVYVGIEDDNPAVAGKGIEYLRQHGVTIHLFDRDLQEVILQENQEFFAWARQQTEKPVEKPIQLSAYENPVTAVELQDLSEEALNLYSSRANLSAPTASAEFQRLLRQQGILVEANGAVVPSGFGLVLFGKTPSQAIPQARLLARAELPDGSASRMEFDSALVLVPDRLAAWLNTVLPSTIDRSRMERREQVDLPFEMLREAVINALIHRDYGLAGQKCQLVVTADTVTISSPGGPIPPITLEQLQSFSAPMKSRNPILHYIFARMGMAEEMGFGLTSLKRQAEKLGLPLPTYAMVGESLVLTIYRTTEGLLKGLGPILEELTDEEREGWKTLANRRGTTQGEYAKALAITPRTAQRHLSHFVQLGLLQRVGQGPATHYRKP